MQPARAATLLHHCPRIGMPVPYVALSRPRRPVHCFPQGMDQPAAGAQGEESLVAALLSTIDFSEPMSFDGEEKTE